MIERIDEMTIGTDGDLDKNKVRARLAAHITGFEMLVRAQTRIDAQLLIRSLHCQNVPGEKRVFLGLSP